MVGPGRPIDTDRYFVICANVLGGCMGTTGPASIDPRSGNAYGLELPVITIRDMVRAQAMLIDRLGIETLLCVLGGSMGGMQVLQWAASFPERVFAAVPIACAFGVLWKMPMPPRTTARGPRTAPSNAATWLAVPSVYENPMRGLK